jgi:hypothetical protein
MTEQQVYCKRGEGKLSCDRFSPAIIAALGYDKKLSFASGINFAASIFTI